MFVRTDRLFLRPAWLEDAPELTRAIAQAPVVRMLARVPWPYSEADARSWIEAERDPFLPELLVTLPEEGGRIIGSCGLHDDDGRTAVGYWIDPDHWNKGYATEALNGVLAVARTLGHRCIVGRHAADNPASGRVLRKVGFRSTGRARPFHSLGRGTMLDAREYALDLADCDGRPDCPMPQAA